jgi:hypothetical protein
MVKFDIKVNPKQRVAYIPKEIVEALGTKLEAIPNLQGIFLYPKGLSPEETLSSMKAICRHLEQEIQLQKRGRETHENNSS